MRGGSGEVRGGNTVGREQRRGEREEEKEGGGKRG